MSGERQWVLTRGFSSFSVGASGSRVRSGERVRVVEASRLAAVEAERDALRTERDAYRETLEWFPGAANEMRADPYANADEKAIAEEAAMRADAVLARFPKNETEQG